MNILGIHIGHDSSACLVVDGQVVADVAEERFTRIKHFAGWPLQSIEYCLGVGGLALEDIDVVAVPSGGPYPELNHLLGLSGRRIEKQSTGRQMFEFARRVSGRGTAKPPLYLKTYDLPAHTEIKHVDHHLAHAASAYYTSGSWEKQVIVTIDGVGDGFSTCVWRGQSGKIEPLLKLGPEASLGWFYGNVTEALGWWHGDGEGTTMGLAPYGSLDGVHGVLAPFHPKFSGGELVEPHDFGRPYSWRSNGAFEWHFDEAQEIQELVHRYGREHIAAEAQRVLETQVIELVLPWLAKENTNRLSCAGGVFLNVKLNQRLWETGLLELQHIYPNAGDSGLAVGAALYAFHEANQGANISKIEHLYLGPEYTNNAIGELIHARSLNYRFVEDVSAEGAQLLATGKIVAWYQGRMESGPRALGNRSLLMSANKAENKDIINAQVKFRQPFRPFCPSLLAEYGTTYLHKGREEAFMITSFDVQANKRDKIPAVVHVDGTLRPQMVKREVNPRYWELIHHFGELTGEYLLLNTSFNIKGEPIICNPREAIRCFYDSGIDVLILGNYVLEKSSL